MIFGRFGKRRIVLAILAVTCAVNVSTFRWIERDRAAPQQALRRSESASLLPLALRAGPTVRARFLVEVWLRERAPGAEVLLASCLPFAPESLRGLGRVRVTVLDLDPIVAPDVARDLMEAATVSGPRRLSREATSATCAGHSAQGSDEWVAAIVAADAPANGPRTFVTYLSEDAVLLVEVAAARQHDLVVPP